MGKGAWESLENVEESGACVSRGQWLGTCPGQETVWPVRVPFLIMTLPVEPWKAPQLL